MIPIHPLEPLVKTIGASPLVVIVFCSLLVMIPTPHQTQLWQILAAPQNILVIVLIPILDVTPVCHASTTHAGFVRIVLSNGPIVPCTTLPLVLKLQRTLMPYANQPKRNPVKITNHLVVLPHHHVVSANLTLHIMLMTVVVPSPKRSHLRSRSRSHSPP